MSKTNIEHICINDYGSGGIYFYKIEVEKDADIEKAVFNLMELKDHYHKTCSWTGQSPEEFVDETHTIITHEELKAMEDK